VAGKWVLSARCGGGFPTVSRWDGRRSAEFVSAEIALVEPTREGFHNVLSRSELGAEVSRRPDETVVVIEDPCLFPADAYYPLFRCVMLIENTGARCWTENGKHFHGATGGTAAFCAIAFDYERPRWFRCRLSRRQSMFSRRRAKTRC